MIQQGAPDSRSHKYLLNWYSHSSTRDTPLPDLSPAHCTHKKKSSRYVKYFMFKQPSFLLTQTEKRAWTAQGWNLGFTCTDICAAAPPSKDLLEYTDGGVSQCHFTSCNLGVGDTAGNCAGSSEWAQHGVRWGLQLCLQG